MGQPVPTTARGVECRRVDATGATSTAADALCLQANATKPATTGACNTRECGRTACIVRALLSPLH